MSTTTQRAIPKRWSRHPLLRWLVGISAACGLVVFPPIGAERSATLVASSGASADEVPRVAPAAVCDDSDDDGCATAHVLATAPVAPRLDGLSVRVGSVERAEGSSRRRPYVACRGRAPPRSKSVST